MQQKCKKVCDFSKITDSCFVNENVANNHKSHFLLYSNNILKQGRLTDYIIAPYQIRFAYFTIRHQEMKLKAISA